MRASTTTVITMAADGVGAASMVLGGLLSVAPRTGGRWLGLAGTGAGYRRALGGADVVLGTTVIAGRSSSWRWRAVAARSLFHLVFAREYVRGGRRRHAAAMCALFVLDAGIATGLRAQQVRATGAARDPSSGAGRG